MLAEEQRANLTAMFSVAGECQMLIVSEEDRRCKDVVVNTEYNKCRIGFYLMDDREGGGIISFSGKSREQRSPAENLRLQPLEMLVLKDGQMPAASVCTYENPFVCQARIQCSTFTSSGELCSRFVISNGSVPQLMPQGNTDG